MFTGIQTYVTLTLAGFMLATMASFGAYYYFAEKKKAELIEQKATLELAVKLNQQTIEFMEQDAARIAAANKNLSSSLAEAERLAFERFKEIDEQELVQSSIKNPLEVEKKINYDYKLFNDTLERLTATGSIELQPNSNTN